MTKVPKYKTNDQDLREATRVYLAERYAGTRVVEEMGIFNGRVRVDLAVLTAPMLGIELKSDRDTLARLPSQMKVYNAVFGSMLIVIGSRHVAKVQAIVPPWWGIVEAVHDGETTILREIRAPGSNPKLKGAQVARLLWRAEALDLLTARGLDRGFRTKRVAQIRKRLCETVADSEIIAEVSRVLSAREGWLRMVPVLQQPHPVSGVVGQYDPQPSSQVDPS